ncbi:MAG: peptidylprolyl isomerase [Deltaproteobacteria bacterium]|nr:peptidylprolyl isomerase [Deltaproteobacteria bacterium]
MAQAKKGDHVKVHYKGTLEDGSEFDASFNREPIEFTLGEGMLLPRFEQAVEGMDEGETRNIKIPAEEAYGPYFQDLVIEFEKEQFPPDLDPKIGEHLELQQEDGSSTVVKIVSISGDKVSLDANHPLAGKDLLFEIRLLAVNTCCGDHSH